MILKRVRKRKNKNATKINELFENSKLRVIKKKWIKWLIKSRIKFKKRNQRKFQFNKIFDNENYQLNKEIIDN